uniref:Uncharacterized protein n=1 Tax=Clytia hemisphaerica TaxID=252671 RepID=A0A7M5UPQ7_9CNID
MPFGNGFLDDRPFRPNRLLDFDDNPSLMGIGGHRGRGGRGGARGHMRGRQGRFQHDRHYMAHNNRRVATNILGRSSAQQRCNDDSIIPLNAETNVCCLVTKIDMNGNPVLVCRNIQCTNILHTKDSIQYYDQPLSAAIPPPEYQSGPPSPNTHPALNNNSRPPLTQMNNLKNVSTTAHQLTEEHVDHFGKLYGCKTMTNIIVMVLAVVFFAIFLTLLVLLA